MKRQFDRSQSLPSRKRSKSFSLLLSPINYHSSEMKIFRDFEDIMAEEQRKRKVWKLVLTGGPCGGKTTGQTRLATFFENLGWKVYRVPETANILLSGGVNFAELTAEAAEKFQVSNLDFRFLARSEVLTLAFKFFIEIRTRSRCYGPIMNLNLTINRPNMD